MIEELALPNGPPTFQRRIDCVCRRALHTTHDLAYTEGPTRRISGWGEQEMHVVGHHDTRMKPVTVRVIP
jgi:hypothetical protein